MIVNGLLKHSREFTLKKEEHRNKTLYLFSKSIQLLCLRGVSLLLVILEEIQCHNTQIGTEYVVGKILWRKEMAIYSSIPAWRILWTENPGGLQFVGLQRVRHD